MVELTDHLKQRYSAALQHVGDDFGIDVIAEDAVYELTGLAAVSDDYPEIVFANSDNSGVFRFPYSVFVNKDCFYFSIYGLVYSCKRFLIYSFSYEEIAVLFYLIFQKHQII